jgi:hypothetical protein
MDVPNTGVALVGSVCKLRKTSCGAASATSRFY